MIKENTSKYLDYFLFDLYLIFFISLIFSLRAISSISIAIILVAGLIRMKKTGKYFGNKKGFFLFFIGCSLLFILQSSALLYTTNVSEGIKLFQRSSGMVVIPLAVFSSFDFLTPEKHRKLTFYFTVLLSIASLYCLASSLFNYFSGAPASVFFYHDLVKPLSQHAIQFSILVFIALVFLISHLKENNRRSTDFLSRLLIAFLSAFLILLSSKLIICFYIFYLFYFFFYKQFYRSRSLVIVFIFIATVAAILLTPNPIGNRYRAIFAGNFVLFTQNKFSQGVYFNGLQFRLLQWRFTYEILNEQQAWVSGLTPGDAQSFLNKKYIETNMYTGIPGTENHGFLGYHSHNQFLQVLLENGLPALAIILFICYSLFKMAKESKRKELKWLAALLFIYCFTDVPLNTQYGIVLFTFFPAFFYLGRERLARQNHSSSQGHATLTVNNKFNLIESASHKQPN
jgi:O-antigen ligase